MTPQIHRTVELGELVEAASWRSSFLADETLIHQRRLTIVSQHRDA